METFLKSVLTRKAADWDRVSGTEGSVKSCSFFLLTTYICGRRDYKLQRNQGYGYKNVS